MKESDKYKALMNLIHNELNISKADIREWIKAAVTEQAQQLVNQAWESFNVKSYIKTQVQDILEKNHMWDRELSSNVYE